MLLAYEKGAGLIVSVGAHFNLVDFLERSRNGMSSTFLTRLESGRAPRRRQGREQALQPRGQASRQLAPLPRRRAVLLTIVVLTTPALSDLTDLIWLKLKIWLGI